MVEANALEERGKNWEPLAMLQRRRVVIEQLKKQGSEGSEDLAAAVVEIDLRVRLYRGLQKSRLRTDHSHGYDEARGWLNSVAARLFLSTADVLRGNRKRSQTVNRNNRAAKTYYGYSATLDADDRACTSRNSYHLHKIDRMRGMLDRDKMVPEDVLSIQAEFDQYLEDLEAGVEPAHSEWAALWDCVGLTDSDDEREGHHHAAAHGDAESCDLHAAGTHAAAACLPLSEDACEIHPDGGSLGGDGTPQKGSSPARRKKAARVNRHQRGTTSDPPCAPQAVEVA